MSTLTDTQKIVKQNEAILRRLDKLEKTLESKKHMVKASVITGLTGWNFNKMAKARRDGSIQYEKRDGGYWYDLNSLNPLFIKKQTA